MLHKFLIFLLFSIFFHLCVIAQVEKKDTIPETKAEKLQEKKPYSVSQFVHETYLFAKQPIQWKGTHNWLKVGIITALTFAVMPLDQTITNTTRYNLDSLGQNYYYSVPVVAGRVYGEWYSIGVVAGLFGLYGVIWHNTGAKKISIELLQAGLYSELVTTVLKTFVGRERPTETTDPFSFRPFTFLNDNFHSMPSGHTTSAFALSTVMSRHAHSTALKIIAYVPAALTMFSRVYQDKHWLSDEILAGGIGYFAGNWVVDLHEGKRHRINVTSIYPTTITVSLDCKSTKKINQPEYLW